MAEVGSLVKSHITCYVTNCSLHHDTVRDKMCENTRVVNQYKSNTEEQAMLGDFPRRTG